MSNFALQFHFRLKILQIICQSPKIYKNSTLISYKIGLWESSKFMSTEEVEEAYFVGHSLRLNVVAARRVHGVGVHHGGVGGSWLRWLLLRRRRPVLPAPHWAVSRRRRVWPSASERAVHSGGGGPTGSRRRCAWRRSRRRDAPRRHPGGEGAGCTRGGWRRRWGRRPRGTTTSGPSRVKPALSV